MRKILQLLIVFASLICLLSCEYIESIERSGETTEQSYPVEAFNTIIFDAPFQIHLKNSINYKVHAEGFDYLIEQINLSQSESTITFSNKYSNSIQKSKLPKLFIESPSINKITVNAPGQLFTSDTIKTNSLQIIVNGGGTYFESDIIIDVKSFALNVFGEINTGTHEVKGIASNAKIHMEGCTYALTKDLICEKVTFVHKSAANCIVHATTDLDATIYSAGNLYYIGDPEIHYEIGQSPILSSTGKVLAYKN